LLSRFACRRSPKARVPARRFSLAGVRRARPPVGRTGEARTDLELAVRLCGNERERAVLRGKLAALD
jgi:hypothetical protein